MKGSILWKFILSVLVFTWAVGSITPISNEPFDSYVRSQAGANVDEFEALLQRAEARAATPQAPSTYVALSQIVAEEKVDLSQFFPDMDVSEVKNLDRRNEILMEVLLRRSQGKIKLGLDLSGGVSVTFEADPKQLSDNPNLRDTQIEQAREVIATRVDSLGVAEPLIRVKGDNRIEVQMPGISTKDNPQIVDVIGKPAVLSFHLVHRTASPYNTAEVPLGYRLMFEEREDRETGEMQRVPAFVKSIPEMTGKSIANAAPLIDAFGNNLVSLKLTSEGADRFARITTQMAEENRRTGTTGQLAIVLDNELVSAPTVREAILGGSAQITGNFSQREAIELSNVLENPLEVPLIVDEMYEVGPSLAAGARDASLMAAIIGGSLVVAFMVLYYWGAGVMAVLAVAFNILWVLGWLAYFGATLTLPGVAALVLTIGMAVDANILILERAREELKAGKSRLTALLAGYDKAFSTIIDANTTTLITAGLLVWLGTGPVKGFGVTLAIGIFGTLFCTLIVNRMLMELLVEKGLLKRIVGFEMFGGSKIRFLDYRKPAFIGSWFVVALGILATVAHRNTILGVDFIGGDEITLGYTERTTVGQINAVAEMSRDDIQALARIHADDPVVADSFAAVQAKGGFGEVSAVFQSVIGQDTESVKVQTGAGLGQAFALALQHAHPEASFEVQGVTHIGPTVGAEVGRSALWSIGLALIGIALYVAIRFEWGFGIGAVVATVHDGLMTVGLFVFLGEFLSIGSGQFTAPMIAAILMVLGYSINDTIVVFDRIREELDLNPEMSLKDVVHLAINRTLSRTLLTSLTTLLATLALYIFAAGVIVDFALVFMIGIFTGTFSSIFIASPAFYWYHNGDRRKVEEHHVLPTYDWHAGAGETTEKKA